MKSDREIQNAVQSHARKSLSSIFEAELTLLPEISLSQPAKKVKPSSLTPEPPSAMLTVILYVKIMRVETLQRLVSASVGVNNNGTSIKNLAEQTDGSRS